MPRGVHQAVIGIWITIGLSLLATFIDDWSGEISSDSIILYIIAHAVYCIFPYKIGKGSNFFRWLYSILTVLSILLLFGYVPAEMTKAELIAAIIVLSIDAFVLFRLFQSEASLWFSPRN